MLPREMLIKAHQRAQARTNIAPQPAIPVETAGTVKSNVAPAAEFMTIEALVMNVSKPAENNQIVHCQHLDSGQLLCLMAPDDFIEDVRVRKAYRFLTGPLKEKDIPPRIAALNSKYKTPLAFHVVAMASQIPARDIKDDPAKYLVPAKTGKKAAPLKLSEPVLTEFFTRAKIINFTPIVRKGNFIGSFMTVQASGFEEPLSIRVWKNHMPPALNINDEYGFTLQKRIGPHYSLYTSTIRPSKLSGPAPAAPSGP